MYLTTHQAAAKAGVAYSTILRACWSGKLKHGRTSHRQTPGRRQGEIRIHSDNLAMWLAK